MTARVPERNRLYPRAMIHKRILEAAETHPDATVESLVDQVGGATANLVERVLEEYGDPAREQPPSKQLTEEPGPPPAPSTAVGEFTRKQRETLQCIYKHPTASQRDVADMLGVTHTAVYHRLQSIDGFDWENRWSFVTTLFEDRDRGCRAAIERALANVETDGDSSPNDPSVFDDPVLSRKVIQACIDSDTIGDKELQRIVEDFLDQLLAG